MINKVFYERLKLFFNILSRGYVTPKKFYNICLCVFSELIKKPGSMGKPFNLMLEPTNTCNLSCPACPCGNKSDKRKKGFMHLENFKKIIDHMSPYVINLTFWNYGEPFMHKDAINMIKYAKSKNMRVITSTNGHFFKDKKKVEELVRSKLDRVIIALDGASQETLQKYRINSKFSDIIEGIENIVEMKKKLKSKYPLIEIQFIIMKHNEHEMDKMRRLAKKIGVNILKYKTVCLYENFNDMGAAELLPSRSELSRYKKNKQGQAVSKIKIKNRCSRLWFATVINWDGTVVPCCHDAYTSFKMGNFLDSNSFKNIWNNKKYTSFRKTVSKNKKNIYICRNCPGDRSTTYKEIRLN